VLQTGLENDLVPQRDTMDDTSPQSSIKSDYGDVWGHVKPDYLIRVTKDYIVYLDKENDLDWETRPEYDKHGPADRKKHNAVLSDAAVLECTPCHGLPTQTKRQFKRLIGEGLSCSFENDYPNAAQMIHQAEAYIRARSEEMSRRWYLSASAFMASVMIALGLLIWVWREPISVALTANFIWLFLAAVAGSCGALLSVIWRSGQLRFDCSAGEALHYLEGASRIWAGALSGVLVALAVKSEFVLAPLTHSGNTMPVIIFAAFVAGAGERLATSIISTFETTHLATTSGRGQKSANSDE
jgi:hypothetical protein